MKKETREKTTQTLMNKLLTIKDITNSLFEGDCLEVLSQLPNKSVDMILCDLPYGTTQNKWDSVIPLDRLWEEYERIIKDNGVIFNKVLQDSGRYAVRVFIQKKST